MEIRVLGSGCNKCKMLLDEVNKAVVGKNDIKVIYVTDYETIASYGIMSTPALMFDNTIISSGRVLTSQEVKGLVEKYK